jgi:outer membrane protein OmpA-like peptidoglycan-associated protein
MKTTLLCLAVLGSYISTVSAEHAQDVASQQRPSTVQIDELATVLEQQYRQSAGPARYQAYKGKMWLSYTQNERSEGSLTSAGLEAWQQAKMISNGLQRHETLSLTTPILSASQVMRRDLWQQIEYLKQSGAIDKAPESLAHAEIMLVWAAAEYCELGWRHANEHFHAAEQALYQAIELSKIKPVPINGVMNELPSMAELNGQGCHGVTAEFWPLNKAIELKAAHKVQNVVHFASNSAELSLASQAVLDQLLNVLQKYSKIDVTLLGYTDKRATQEYNLELAQRRIQSVQDYLAAQGIAAERIQFEAKGAVDLQTDADLRLASAKSRRVVLQLSSSEQLQVRLEPQWQDLQIESNQQKAKVN